MRKPKNHPFDVVRPPMVNNAMCIYKMSFPNGFFYIGATTNLGDRITKHILKLATRTHTISVQKAFEGCNSVKFEFVEFVNDKLLLPKKEERYLLNNTNNPYSLNIEVNSKSFSRSTPVAKIDLQGNVIERYSSIVEAAKRNGKRAHSLAVAIKNGYTLGGQTYCMVDPAGQLITMPHKQRSQPPTARKVIQFDLQGNQIATFPSTTQASKETGIHKRSMHANLTGKYKHTGGYVFKYAHPI